MTIEKIQSIIQNNINDPAANVNEAIDMSIKFLSNFFYVRKIDSSNTVTTGDLTIQKPDRCLKIMNLKISNDYIPKADENKLQEIEDNNVQKWYIEDEFLSGNSNVIHLTKAISSADNGATASIWYLSGFAPLGGVAESETDVPERLETLLIMFATYFYYGILVSYVKNNKAEFPNMTVWDVIAIWDTWRVHAYDMLDIVKQQHFK